MEPLLRVRDVGVGRPDNPRLNAVEFSVHDNDSVAILGANGAGKTSLIRLLAGVCAPDRGEVLLNGQPLQRTGIDARRAIGYLPQRVAAYPDLSVDENLRWTGQLHGLRGSALRDAVDQVCAAFDLDGCRRRLATKLSAGMLQRLGLAQAVVHRPRLLILDEPTAGLDPLQLDQVRSLLRSLASDCALVLATHLLDDVEHLCNRVVLLDAGRKRLEHRVTPDSDLLALFRHGDAAETTGNASGAST
ncbi:MAG: ABC transporter ATP-binding protein [Gammaproteobacteria bacterium]|nr:ABC transporter ATP-binding protein [Gammaproteobacteria bacterium]